MNVHDDITDEQLLLYHYRDGLDAAERAHIAAALTTQPGLASRLQSLVAQLDSVSAAPESTVPSQALERWHAAIDRAVSNESAHTSHARRSFPRWPAFATAAAATVAITVAVLVFNRPADDAAPQIASSEPASMQWYLASTERQLAEVSHSSGEERTAMIDAVIAQNRMFAIAAERAGDQRLAGALRSFTPILERLAQDDPGSSDSAAEMAQLNFELRVMQARLAAEAAAPSPTITAL